MKDIKQTISYAISSGLDMATFFIATPYPETDLYKICIEEKLLQPINKDNYLSWIGAVSRAQCASKIFKMDELNNLVKQAQRNYFKSRIRKILLNPLLTIRKVSDFYGIKYIIKMIIVYMGRFFGRQV